MLSGSLSNGTTDLGNAGNRFKDLYLSNEVNITGASSPTLRLIDSTNTNTLLAYAQNSTSHVGTYSNHPLVFDTNSTERARIDSSGNLLVSKTSNDNSTAGVVLRDTGEGSFVASGQRSGLFNRLSSDGEIINFRKNGTSVGSIGTYAGDLTIGDDDIAIRFDTGSGLVPWDLGANTGGSARDAAIDIGVPSARFRDLYLSGDVIAPNIVPSNGIFLGGTSNANKLDDYEEGTWTPVVADAQTGGNTASIASAVGFYTKVGNIVHVTIRAINITTTGMTSGNDVFIRGLPFTQNGQVNFMGAIQISDISFDGSPVLYGSGGTTIAKIGESASGTVLDLVTVGQLTSGSADIQAHLTYRIS